MGPLGPTLTPSNCNDRPRTRSGADVPRPSGAYSPLAVALLCACDPLASYHGAPTIDAKEDAEALLVVHPTSLDFGTVPVTGESVVRVLNLENPSQTDLIVYGHDQPSGLYGDDTSVFRFDTAPLVPLAPGESISVPVHFSPHTDGIWEAALEVNPGGQSILIRGAGSAPVIGVGPTETPVAPIGCTVSTSMRIANQGSAALELDAIALDDPWDAWGLDTSALPATIAPGSTLTVQADFTPRYADDTYGARPANATIHSNDPAAPQAPVPLYGEAEQLTLVRENFTYAVSNDIDLLVVADTSHVVQGWLPNVKAAMAPLVFGLEDAGASLQTAVVTGASPCPSTVPIYADSSTDLEQRVDHLALGLSGDAGTAYNQLGILAGLSLDQAGAGGCLEGFLRPNSRLHVLLVTGVADVSTEDAIEQVDLMREALDEAHLLDEHRFKVSALMGTDASICLGAVFSASYLSIVESTGGTVVNLCSSALGTDIKAIRDNALQGLEAAYTYPLVRSPIAESIRVRVDNEPWTDFQYSAETNTVLFDGPDIPGVNSNVEIEYREQQDCLPGE